MSKETKKSSPLPIVIIGIVLIAAVAGFYALYSTSKSPKPDVANGSPKPANNSRQNANIPPTAPPGAPLGINMKGDPSAKVTIEEFADFQCPSCAVAHPVMKEVEATFAGNKNVRFVFRHFPLPIHDKSYDAAVAVEAAGAQGGPKFWAMMDQVFTNQQQWATNLNYREVWKGYAEKIGLDVVKWENDMAGIGAKGRIDLDIARARGVGVASTPTVYINGRPIPFTDVNAPTLKQLIEAEIEAVSKAAAPANTSTAPAANSTNAAK